MKIHLTSENHKPLKKLLFTDLVEQSQILAAEFLEAPHCGCAAFPLQILHFGCWGPARVTAVTLASAFCALTVGIDRWKVEDTYQNAGGRKAEQQTLEPGRHGLGRGARKLAQKLLIETEVVAGQEWKNRKHLEAEDVPED